MYMLVTDSFMSRTANNEAALNSAFAEFGEANLVPLRKPKTGKRRNCIVVKFADFESAMRCKKAMHIQEPVEYIRG